MKKIKIRDDRFIGDGEIPYIIAEIGINHNGSPDLACEMVKVAAESGVDAIKFQKRTVQEMYIKSFLDEPYNKPYSFGRTYGDHKLFLELSDDIFFELQSLAYSLNLDFIVSGFDYTSFEFIEKRLKVDIHKIASPFVTHYPLLKQVAMYGKPLILSTGMHSYSEVERAVSFIKQYNDKIILFQTTTMYPCPDELVNLKVLKRFREELDVLVGYSSHDRGVVLPAASIAMGACMIEKHFTIDRTMIGPDHAASVEKEGMEKIVKYARGIFSSLGTEEKSINKHEAEARLKYGVSIVSRVPINGGDVIREEMITVKCPGGGISPVHFWDIIGKKMKTSVDADQIIHDDDIE